MNLIQAVLVFVSAAVGLASLYFIADLYNKRGMTMRRIQGVEEITNGLHDIADAHQVRIDTIEGDVDHVSGDVGRHEKLLEILSEDIRRINLNTAHVQVDVEDTAFKPAKRKPKAKTKPSSGSKTVRMKIAATKLNEIPR